MKPLVVAISDSQASADPEAVLVTYALGSCIAVIVHEPERKIGGMLHYMLPDSSLDREKAALNPFMFADTGIPKLMEQVRGLGGNPKRLVVRLAGGAQVLDTQNVFDIGKRNYLAAKRVLWKLGVFVSSEAVGGEKSRTVRLEILTGRSWLREGGRPESEFAAGAVAGTGAAVPARSVLPPPKAGGNIWPSGL